MPMLTHSDRSGKHHAFDMQRDAHVRVLSTLCHLVNAADVLCSEFAHTSSSPTQHAGASRSSASLVACSPISPRAVRIGSGASHGAFHLCRPGLNQRTPTIERRRTRLPVGHLSFMASRYVSPTLVCVASSHSYVAAPCALALAQLSIC
jgi:hypothetical protein